MALQVLIGARALAGELPAGERKTWLIGCTAQRRAPVSTSRNAVEAITIWAAGDPTKVPVVP